MPKLGTTRGAAKRLKFTANGFKHAQFCRRHILTKKLIKRKHRLRNKTMVKLCDIRAVQRVLKGS